MTSPQLRKCEHCLWDVPIRFTICPHCGQRQRYPNVELANSDEEKTKLRKRLEQVEAEAKQRNCALVLQQFVDSCRNSVGVIAVGLRRLFYQFGCGTEIWATYDQLHQLSLRSSQPTELDFQKLRRQCEIELLGSYDDCDKIIYGCLSLDGRGLASYGECHLALAESMIAHRTSCFEGNTAVIYHHQHHFNQNVRSDWNGRELVCAAMRGRAIGPATSKAEFAQLLVAVGPTKLDDIFIEVHIFGPLTAKSFQSIHIDKSGIKPDDECLRPAIEKMLNDLHLPFTIQ